METTRRRFASARRFFASSPASRSFCKFLISSLISASSSSVAFSSLLFKIAIFSFATAPASMFFASSISSSALKRGTLPISFKYIRTGSSMDTPSGTERSIFSTSISSSSSTSSKISSSESSSVIRSTSILFASRKSRILSNCSASNCMSAKKSLISWYSNMFFFFLAKANRSFNFC